MPNTDIGRYYYDILYERIDLEKRVSNARGTFARPTGPPTKIFRKLLSTYEMNRQLYLRQSGLKYLRFPSAGYNRFAHAIGSWQIGTYALETVRVQMPGGLLNLCDWFSFGSPTPNKQHDAGQSYEFLIALLLHDCGHCGFSHLLERDPELPFVKNDLTHEKIGAELIKGEGPFASNAKKNAEQYNCETISEVLDKEDWIDREYVADLISLNMSEFVDKYPEEYAPIKGLLDSEIDLDRIDHCLRDAKGLGIGIGQLNIKALLENIVLFPNRKSIRIGITKEGIPHILSLLFNRELIWQIAFDDIIGIAFDTMFNFAIKKVLEEKAILINELLFYTDDELLSLLRDSDNKDVTEIYSKILRREPYHYINYSPPTQNLNSSDIRKGVKGVRYKLKMSEFDLIYHIPFSKKLEGMYPWLNIYSIEDEKLLGNKQGKHGHFWEMIKQYENDRRSRISFFVKNKSDIRKARKALKTAY